MSEKKIDLEKMLEGTNFKIVDIDDNFLSRNKLDITALPYDQQNNIIKITDGILKLNLTYRKMKRTDTITLSGLISTDDQIKDYTIINQINNQMNLYGNMLYKQTSDKLKKEGIHNDYSIDGITFEDNSRIDGSGTFHIYSSNEYALSSNPKELNKVIKQEIKNAIIVLSNVYDSIRSLYNNKDKVSTKLNEELKYSNKYFELGKKLSDVSTSKEFKIDLNGIKFADQIVFESYKGDA